MPNLHVSTATIREIKVDRVDATGRRRVVAQAVAPSGGLALYEWQPDGVLRQLTPDDAVLAHYDVHDGLLWWFDSEKGSEEGHWMVQALDDPPGAGTPVPGVAKGMVVGGIKSAADTTVLGVGVDGDTLMYVLRRGDDFRRPEVRHVDTLLGGMSMVTALSADGTTATITDVPGGAEYEENAFRKRQRDHDVATWEVTHTYADAMYQHFRHATASPTPGDKRVLSTAPTPEGYVGLFLRDPEGTDVRLTGPAGTASSPDEELPQDRLPTRADLFAAAWIPGPVDSAGIPQRPTQVLATAQAGFRTALYLCDVDNSRAARVRIPDGMGVHMTSETGTAIFKANACVLSPDKILVELSGYAHERGWATIDTATGEVDLRNPYRGLRVPKDIPGAVAPEYGTSKSGVPYVLFQPEGPVPKGGRKTVVEVHGGPYAMHSDTRNVRAAMYTKAGYNYVSLNYALSPGRGLAQNAEVLDGPVIGRHLAEIAEVHDHLIDAGVVDRRRSAIMGQSYGGMLAASAAALQPGRWAAAVTTRGIMDVNGPYRDPGVWPSLRFAYQRMFGKPEHRRYVPLHNAERNETPILVISATHDRRGPLKYAEKYVARAKAAGANVVLKVIGGGHVAAESAGLVGRGAAKPIDVEAEALRWIERHVPAVRPHAPGLGRAAALGAGLPTGRSGLRVDAHDPPLRPTDRRLSRRLGKSLGLG